MRLRLHEIGNSFAVTDRDFGKLERFLAEADFPVGPGGRPKRIHDSLAAATA